MQQATNVVSVDEDMSPGTLAFFRDVLETLNRSRLPYLVGGAYALKHYAGVNRQTKDFDIFVARSDYDRISQVLSEAGYETELTYPHWLAKISLNGDTIDLVFSSGNGISEVDEQWFAYAVPAEVFGVPVRICPAEEILWSKAYIMERERYDGADVAHLILALGHELDWPRMLRRFGEHWRLLLSHLVLFGFIYPGHREAVPEWVINELIMRLNEEIGSPEPENDLCGGTLLSREQYLNDIDLGYRDARLPPYGNMSRRETASWTDAIRYKYE